MGPAMLTSLASTGSYGRPREWIVIGRRSTKSRCYMLPRAGAGRAARAKSMEVKLVPENIITFELMPMNPAPNGNEDSTKSCYRTSDKWK